MKVSIIAVGKLKTPHWAAAQEDYLARVRRYTSLTLHELKDRIGQGLDESSALDKESTDILTCGQELPAFVVLTSAGKLLDSMQWSATLQKLLETYSTVGFVIGGSVGLSEKVLKKSRLQLALSPMTFPHEMARIIFLEQLYRAFTIVKGEKYHK